MHSAVKIGDYVAALISYLRTSHTLGKTHAPTLATKSEPIYHNRSDEEEATIAFGETRIQPRGKTPFKRKPVTIGSDAKKKPIFDGCWGCGSMQHRLSQCPNPKQKSYGAAARQYLTEGVDPEDLIFNLSMQMDTALGFNDLDADADDTTPTVEAGSSTLPDQDF